MLFRYPLHYLQQINLENSNLNGRRHISTFVGGNIITNFFFVRFANFLRLGDAILHAAVVATIETAQA